MSEKFIGSLRSLFPSLAIHESWPAVFSATIVDVCTTAALMTVSSEPGVSIDLNVTYMNACPHGEEVLIESKLLKVRKTAVRPSTACRPTTPVMHCAQNRTHA